MKAVTASISHEDPFTAGRQTAFEVLDRLETKGFSAPDLVLVFASSRLAPERMLAGLWSALPSKTRLCGCSSYAEIGPEDAHSGSVTAMGICFGDVEWELFKLEGAVTRSADAGRALGAAMRSWEPALVVVLADGLQVDGEKLVGGLREALAAGTPLIGGVASDDFEFARTFELFDREVIEGGVVALALRGPIAVAPVARAGFQPVGSPRTCTRVEGDKLVLEIDGVSALSLYKEMLGAGVTARPDIGVEFPLAFVVGEGADYMRSDERGQVIRVVRHLDEERGALLCNGAVHEGAKVRMTRATKGDLIDAAVLAMHEAKRAVPNADLALVFDCAGRKRVLGSRYQEEIRAALSALGPDTPVIGFYTYGEIAPANGTATCHDETFTAVLVGRS